MSLEFHNTIMGRQFIEGTVPNLVEQLETLNRNITKLNDNVARILHHLPRQAIPRPERPTESGSAG